jgi:hypothetical protein
MRMSGTRTNLAVADRWTIWTHMYLKRYLHMTGASSDSVSYLNVSMLLSGSKTCLTYSRSSFLAKPPEAVSINPATVPSHSTVTLARTFTVIQLSSHLIGRTQGATPVDQAI